MEEYVLDCRQMGSKDEIHKYLRQQLGFPDYYGNNLDALADSLSEKLPLKITLTESQTLSEGNPYQKRTLKFFRRYAAINEDFELVES